jgi:hypothetical protein
VSQRPEGDEEVSRKKITLRRLSALRLVEKDEKKLGN